MMDITSKQRAALRSFANTMDAVLYIGKEGITPNVIKEAYDALEARELIKCSVQKGAPMDAREACNLLCKKVHATPIQCIGNKFVVFKRSRENPRYLLED